MLKMRSETINGNQMKKTRDLFYSKQEKLFSIWRLLRLIVIAGLLIFTINLLFRLCKFQFNDIVFKLTFVASIILVNVFLDKEKLEWLGIELKIKSIIFFIIGIIWAYICKTQIEIVSAFASSTTIHLANPFSKDAIISLVFFLFVIGLSEELLFRSYIIPNVARDTNLAIAFIISAILFSLIHFGFGTSVKDVFIMGFAFTIFLGLIFVMTKNIFIAVGFHGAWDAFGKLFSPLLKSANSWHYTPLIILLVNISIFYLIFRKRLNFDIKELIKHRP